LQAEDLQIYEQLMEKAKCGGGGFDDVEAGPDCMSGSQLPSHSDVNKSCLTSQRIVVSSTSVSFPLTTLFTCSHSTLRGVDTGWTGVDMSTPLLPEVVPEINAILMSFYGEGESRQV